jgi:hypothetical protein
VAVVNRGASSRISLSRDCALALRARHFIDHDVVVNSTVELDQRRNGTGLDHRFVGDGSCKSSNGVHGLPSREDEKFNLIAELTPREMRADKSRDLAQFGRNFFAEVPRIRVRIRCTCSSTPFPKDHVSSLGGFVLGFCLVKDLN